MKLSWCLAPARCKPNLNRARVVKETMRERANRSRCKGMLNEVVPKSYCSRSKRMQGESEREEREREEEETALLLSQDFLCVWERFRKGNTDSHIPPRQNGMIHLHLVMVFSFIAWKTYL